jgi:hypothetical protein
MATAVCANEGWGWQEKTLCFSGDFSITLGMKKFQEKNLRTFAVVIKSPRPRCTGLYPA